MSEKITVVPDRSGYVPVENGTRQTYWEYFGKGEKQVVVLLFATAVSSYAEISSLLKCL